MLVNKPSSFHLALICAIFFFQINRWSLIAIYCYCFSFSFSLRKLFKFKKGFYGLTNKAVVVVVVVVDNVSAVLNVSWRSFFGEFFPDSVKAEQNLRK